MALIAPAKNITANKDAPSTKGNIPLLRGVGGGEEGRRALCTASPRSVRRVPTGSAATSSMGDVVASPLSPGISGARSGVVPAFVSGVGGFGDKLARFCSSKRAAASNLDAPSSADPAGGEDARGADGVRDESLAAWGAIPRSVFPRAALALGSMAGLDETRTAGGRDGTLGRSDTGLRSDAGLGSSDSGFDCSDDSGLSAEAHASSMSSVATGAIDA